MWRKTLNHVYVTDIRRNIQANILVAEVVLTITYPESYPETAPDLTLSAPPNAAKYPYLEISDDRIALLESLAPTIEENLGMAMIYTLVSTLKDLAEQLIAERQAAQQKLKDLEAQKAEEVENAKFHGTAVTRETFLEWRRKFVEEMKEEEERRRLEQEAEDKKRKIKNDERFTGRQLWEKGLVRGGDEEEDSEDGVASNLNELKLEA